MANFKGFSKNTNDFLFELQFCNTIQKQNENLIKYKEYITEPVNLLYFDLPRLSVDIDLDFVGHVDRDEMMTTRKRINELIQLQMKASGYALSSKSRFVTGLIPTLPSSENPTRTN